MKNIRLERHMYSLNLKSNDRQCFSWSILKHIPFLLGVLYTVYIFVQSLFFYWTLNLTLEWMTILQELWNGLYINRSFQGSRLVIQYKWFLLIVLLQQICCAKEKKLTGMFLGQSIPVLPPRSPDIVVLKEIFRLIFRFVWFDIRSVYGRRRGEVVVLALG